MVILIINGVGGGGVGYATPQISRTFPGYLLSARVMRATWAGAAASRRASRVMATIAQLAKVQALGRARFFAYCVLWELSTGTISHREHAVKRRRVSA